jgi:hypothetical protein
MNKPVKFELKAKHIVARVQCRGDRPPPSSGVECLSWQIWEDKEFLSFISGKNWNGSRHLVF